MMRFSQKLATSRGLAPKHFKAIQKRNRETIKWNELQIKENNEDYVPCFDCDRIFHKMVLTSGICQNCIDEVLKRR